MAIPALFCAFLALQDPVFSGPQKGEKLTGFKVLVMTGEQKEKEVDLVSEWNGAPSLIVFIHETTRPAAQLFRRLDEHAAKRQGLKSVFILLTEDMNKSERYAPLLAGILKLKNTVGISVDGKEGPGNYGLNKEVTLTILLAKENKVAGNWALRSPNETYAPEICKAIDDLLGVKEEPKPDLESRVAALEKEIKELRAIIEQLSRRPAPADRKKSAGSPPKDEKLLGLFRRLINLQAAEMDVDATIKEIEEYAAGNEDIKKQAADAFTFMLDQSYGTDYARSKAKEAAGRLK